MFVLLEAATPQELAWLARAGAVATFLAGMGKLIGWLVELRKQKAYKAVPATPSPASFDLPGRTSLAPILELRQAEFDRDRMRMNWQMEELRRQLDAAQRERDSLQGTITARDRDIEMLKNTLRHLRKAARTVDGIQDVTELALPDDEAATWVVPNPADMLATPMRPPPVKRIVPV